MKLRAPLALLAVHGLACTQDVEPSFVPALSRSGRSAFVCLGAPTAADAGDDAASPGRLLTSCTRRLAQGPKDYGTPGDEIPHLYALVTQTTYGEIAVVDVTAQENNIIDQKMRSPGANFLTVGAQPVDIVATPKGTAAFVSVAEPGREGIFALPTKKIRGCENCALSSWPACSLPSAPGEMVMLSDPMAPPADQSEPAERYACDAPHGEPDPEPRPNGDLSAEGLGRHKIIVPLPELGGLAVIDAQRLLNREPGSFDPCPVDRWLPLAPVGAGTAPSATPDGAPHGAECVDARDEADDVVAIGPSRPAGLALDGERLYVADLGAPVVHVIDLPTPCEPAELPPLLPASAEDPARVVTTSRVAVSPGAPPNFAQYVYAIDAGDGSIMVFDVSGGASGSKPIVRANPEWNPFQPPDRIRFAAPVRDLAIVQRDVPATLATTGVSPEGVRCDPDPAVKCDSALATCDPSALYRTSSNKDAGAGPLPLRGTFAYLVLADGQIVVIDIDDLDAACRGPSERSPRRGCAGDPPWSSDGTPLVSGEVSCNAVMEHAPRSAKYVLSRGNTGRYEPGLQVLPLLYDRGGATIPLPSGSPKMRATLPSEATTGLTLAVSTGSVTIGDKDAREKEEGMVRTSSDEPSHAMLMNLEDPRAHVVDQIWSVTYEGALPGFGQNQANLEVDVSGGGLGVVLRDPEARFCGRGVQSEGAVRDHLGAAALEALEAEGKGVTAGDLADFVQITSELPDEDDFNKQHSGEGGSGRQPACSTGECTYQACREDYGTALITRPKFRIKEAYEDRLILEAPSKAALELAQYCFGVQVKFNVRAGAQWVVRGEASGFLHHVIADPATGECRNACGTRLSRLNGRVIHNPDDGRVEDGSIYAFINPMFRFAITDGKPDRDMQFRFVTQGAFATLSASISTGWERQPQAIRWVPSTGELAVTDGALEGLLLISAGNPNDVRAYY